MTFLLQSLLLSLSFAFVYIWQISPLSEYTVQILGFLVFLFLIISVKIKNFNPFNKFENNGVGGVFILNIIIFLLIFSTGNLNSNLFFLLYFLGFGVAFVFEPAIVFVFLLGTILIFYPQVSEGDTMTNVIKLGSLALICPLAYFFGKEYRKEEQMSENTQQAAEKIEKSADELLRLEAKKLDEQGVEKVDEILEEAEELRNKTN